MNMEKLADNILKRMPKNLTKMEQARYIYIELGKLVTFDEEYWLGNSRTQKRIYKSAQRIKNFKGLENKKVICVSLTNLYNYLMEQIGIRAFSQRESDEDPHVYSIIEIDDKRYKADLQQDLRYIQTKRRTRNFGQSIKGGSDVTPENIKQIDKKIGYSYEGEIALAELTQRLIKETSCYEEVEDRVEYILSQLANCEEVQNMGYIEKIQYYRETITKMINAKDYRRVHYTDMYSGENETRKYTQCISVQRRNNTYSRFIYSEKTGTYLSIDEKTLEKVKGQGLKEVGAQKLPKSKLVRNGNEDQQR